jgi:hypothetical protein
MDFAGKLTIEMDLKRCFDALGNHRPPSVFSERPSSWMVSPSLEATMPVLLWLLGVPIVVIIALYLFGVV